ncbi:ABC transporter permease subunit [Ruminococcaceae bacterium OttesenSCG-928-L11]|nr:ABC transporter permease subunit [Ruminococcaceae bacterium OttesenSCG-928-L11]
MEMTMQAKKQKSARRMRLFKNQIWLQLFAIIGVVFMLLFSIVPMFGIIMAFKNYSINQGIAGIFTSDWVGLKHFKEFFGEQRFPELLRNTLALSTLKLIFSFPMPILLAIMLHEARNMRYKKFVQTVSYFPHFISWIVCYGVVYALASEKVGVLQDMLMKIGLISEPVPFLTSPNWFYGVSVVLSIWKSSGWWAIIFLASISGIDPELYEAAVVDGAGRLKRIRHITLPGIKGSIVTMLIISIGSFLGGGLVGSNFEQSYLFGNALNNSTAELIQTYSFKVGLVHGRFAYATAISLVESCVSLFLILTSNFVAKKTAGSGLF